MDLQKPLCVVEEQLLTDTMMRLKIRWALTRMALIISVLLIVQFLSQMGLLTIKNPDCEQMSLVQKSGMVQGDQENDFEQQIEAKQVRAPFTQEPKTMKLSDSLSYDSSDRKDAEKPTDYLTRLVAELSETRQSLVRSALHYHRLGKHIEDLNRFIYFLDGKTTPREEFPGQKSSKDVKHKKEVCPEKFMGKTLAYGYPFFRKGFQRVECSEFVPIDQLVTLLMTFPGELSPQDRFKFLEGAAKYYPNLRIVVASKENRPYDDLTKLKLNLKNMVVKDPAHGETWTKMLQEVTTPYALFAPEVTHFTDDIELERLVRMLSYNEDAVVAGGSHRNLQGEWDIGCLQVTFRNWTAFFRGGYYRSVSECVVCDLLSGPFMAKTEAFKKLGLDER